MKILLNFECCDKDVAFNSCVLGEKKCWTPKKTFEDWIRCASSGSSNTEEKAAAQAVNGAFPIGTAVVEDNKLLVVAFFGPGRNAIIDLLQIRPVALQNVWEVWRTYLYEWKRHWSMPGFFRYPLQRHPKCSPLRSQVLLLTFAASWYDLPRLLRCDDPWRTHLGPPWNQRPQKIWLHAFPNVTRRGFSFQLQ